MLFPTTASYCQGPSWIIMGLIHRNINNTTVTPKIYDHINLSENSTNEPSKMKLNYKYIHALACDGKKFTKNKRKKKKSKNLQCNKMGSSVFNRGLSPWNMSHFCILFFWNLKIYWKCFFLFLKKTDVMHLIVSGNPHAWWPMHPFIT